MTKWALTPDEVARLNPPEDAAERDEWLPVGYIPQPTTRLGWFAYHVVHGLWMRYPLRKVLGYAFANTQPDSEPVVVESEPVEFHDAEVLELVVSGGNHISVAAQLAALNGAPGSMVDDLVSAYSIVYAVAGQLNAKGAGHD
jgi:hypothetical protein